MVSPYRQLYWCYGRLIGRRSSEPDSVGKLPPLAGGTGQHKWKRSQGGTRTAVVRSHPKKPRAIFSYRMRFRPAFCDNSAYTKCIGRVRRISPTRLPRPFHLLSARYRSRRSTAYRVLRTGGRFSPRNRPTWPRRSSAHSCVPRSKRRHWGGLWRRYPRSSG